MFAYPALILASLACLACAGCDDPIAKALGLGGSAGCKCSPDRARPTLPALPEVPATPKRKPCPGPGPCPLNGRAHVHVGPTGEIQ